MPSAGSQSLAWLLAIVYGAAAPMETLAAAEEGNAGEGARLPGPARDPTIASSWRPAWRLPPLPWRPPPELSLPPSLMSPLIPSYCEQFNLNLYALVMGTIKFIVFYQFRQKTDDISISLISNDRTQFNLINSFLYKFD